MSDGKDLSSGTIPPAEAALLNEQTTAERWRRRERLWLFIIFAVALAGYLVAVILFVCGCSRCQPVGGDPHVMIAVLLVITLSLMAALVAMVAEPKAKEESPRVLAPTFEAVKAGFEALSKAIDTIGKK